MRRYLLTDGALGFDEGVPEHIQVVFAARWLNGAASVEWLLDHPDWWKWVDICSTAHEQAIAEKNKPQAE